MFIECYTRNELGMYKQMMLNCGNLNGMQTASFFHQLPCNESSKITKKIKLHNEFQGSLSYQK